MTSEVEDDVSTRMCEAHRETDPGSRFLSSTVSECSAGTRDPPSIQAQKGLRSRKRDTMETARLLPHPSI